MESFPNGNYLNIPVEIDDCGEGPSHDPEDGQGRPCSQLSFKALQDWKRCVHLIVLQSLNCLKPTPVIQPSSQPQERDQSTKGRGTQHEAQLGKGE